MKYSIKDLPREWLTTTFAERGFKRGAEIGVRMGHFSEIICKNNPGLEKLYAVDPWDVVFEEPMSAHLGLEKQEKYYRLAKDKLSQYPACEIVKKTSLEAVRDIPYESLDFVYIDGAHTFDYVMVDIIEWSRRVKKGGIVSGDDYKPHQLGNLMLAVDTYVQDHNIGTLNLLTKSDPTPRKNVPNWWFVK